MNRACIRESILTSIVLGLVAILYKYWLTLPVLNYLSVGQWRATGVAVAAILGVAFGMAKLPAYYFGPAVALGLLLGEAWAELSFPSDTQTPF